MTASAATEPCELYIDHGSARPCVTEGHHVYPQYLQQRVYGSTTDTTRVFLCSTCHDNVHAWLYWLLGERQKPSPEAPARAKALAVRAHTWYTEAQAAKGSG